MKTIYRVAVCVLCFLMLCLSGCVGQTNEDMSYPLDDHLRELFAYASPADTDTKPMPEVHLFYDNTLTMLGYMRPPKNQLPGDYCDARDIMDALHISLPANYKTFWLTKDKKNSRLLSWQEMDKNLFDLYLDTDVEKKNFYVTTNGESFYDENGNPLGHAAGAGLPETENGVDIGPLRLLIDSNCIDPDAITVIATDLLDQNCMGSELASALYESVIASDENSENAVCLLAMNCQFYGDRVIPDPYTKNASIYIERAEIICPLYWILTGPKEPLCRFVDKLNVELKAKGITEGSNVYHCYYLHGKDMSEVEFKDVALADTVDLFADTYDLDKKQIEAILGDADFYGNRNIAQTSLKTIFGNEINGFSEVFAYQYAKADDSKFRDDKEMLLNLYVPLPGCTADNLENYRCYLDPQLTESGAMLFEEHGEQNGRIFAFLPDNRSGIFKAKEKKAKDEETEEAEIEEPETESSKGAWVQLDYYEFVNAGFTLSTEILEAGALPHFLLSDAVMEEQELREEVIPQAVMLDQKQAQYWLRLTLHSDFSEEENPYEALVLDIPVWASIRNDVPGWVSEWNTTSPSEDNCQQTYGLKAFCEKMADTDLSQKAYDEKNGVNVASFVLTVGGLPTA